MTNPNPRLKATDDMGREDTGPRLAASGEARSTGNATTPGVLHELPASDAFGASDRQDVRPGSARRRQDAQRVLADAGRVVTANPGPALVAAAALGYLLGRTLSRD
jgi:hypothetical protein